MPSTKSYLELRSLALPEQNIGYNRDDTLYPAKTQTPLEGLLNVHLQQCIAYHRKHVRDAPRIFTISLEPWLSAER